MKISETDWPFWT